MSGGAVEQVAVLVVESYPCEEGAQVGVGTSVLDVGVGVEEDDRLPLGGDGNCGDSPLPSHALIHGVAYRVPAGSSVELAGETRDGEVGEIGPLA